jgi:hypothetical protein
MRRTTKKSFSFAGIVLLLISTVVVAQDGASSGSEVLTNDKVITMVKAGLPPSIIVNKIHASKTNFNTDTDELIRLQNAHVPTDIVNAMVEASTHASAVTSRTGAGDVSNADPNDPAAAHEAGIYLYQEKDGQKKMIQLEPSVSKQTKTGGVFASAMTGGLAKIKFKAALAGQNAPLQIDSARPVFYFYFEVKNAGLSTNTYYATSPNEFVLVALDVKANTREVTVSQANAFGAQSGTMDKAARGFKIEKLSPGVFKVTPQEDLAEGEYGFYNGGGAGPSGGAKVFDFGIKLPR